MRKKHLKIELHNLKDREQWLASDRDYLIQEVADLGARVMELEEEITCAYAVQADLKAQVAAGRQLRSVDQQKRLM